MDIQILSRMLLELLQDHERVGLPGVGTFVVEEVPAYFSDKGFTINPPYKKLTFRMYREDDGLLSSLYAKANGIRVEEAAEVIAAFCADVRGILLAERMIALPGLGRLKATKGNDFFFVPEEELSIFADELGLEPISLKSHNEIPDQVRNDSVHHAEECLPSRGEKSSVQKAAPQLHDAPASHPGLDPESNTDIEEPKPLKKKSHNGWKVTGWILLIAAVLCGAFVLASRLAPGSTDFLLYTPEELEILNY